MGKSLYEMYVSIKAHINDLTNSYDTVTFAAKPKFMKKTFQVINRSDSDDLKSSEIKIEVRMRGLYIISNYVPNIQHLPGIIEGDVLDYFKILCRRLERMNDDTNNAKRTTMPRSK